MKRQILKSISAFCMGVMTLVAASSLVVSCNDKLWDELEDVKGQLSELDQKIEDIKAQLEALASRVDALYTLQFQASDSNELQYSFDGGQTWKGTGINLAEERPEVSLVDNGDSVTITVGDQSYTIEKPKEIVFELRSGKLYFESEGTMQVNIKSEGIEDITVMSAPKGWWAEITSDGKVEITAPDYESTQGTYDYDTWEEIPGENAALGYVKVHACGADGKCMVGKIAVEVTERPVVVKAYGGNAYFEAAGNYPPMFYYGACLRSDFETEVAALLEDMNTEGFSEDYNMNGDGWENEPYVEATVAELLGEDTVLGEEYVVWALVEDYSKTTYTMDDFIVCYYSDVDVTVTEDEAERTAYNVTVTVEVTGADSYLALAVPENYAATPEDVEYYKEMFVMSLGPDSWEGPMGKLYTESYTGSALDIAEGTTSSMSGNYAPDRKIYVMILPLDGRSSEDYTVEDVYDFEFKTAELVAGGSIDLSAAQVTEYVGEVFDYDIYQYVEATITLDPYTQVGVEAKPSIEGEWEAFYYGFLSEEDYADYGAADEDLVDYLLEGWGMTPSDLKKWPAYLTHNVEPATTVHFVGFIVDKAGKYGQLAKVELTSKELVKADFTWVDPIKTNVVDGVLKNTVTLEFTPEFEGDAEVASYKYVWQQTDYYNPYEGKDDAQMAEDIFFSTSAKTVAAADLVDGKIVVENHRYGSSYYFAVLPIDADGAPGMSAAILEYECVFAMDNVITEGSDFTATEPGIKINLPDWDEYYTEGEYGEASYYGYEDQTEWGYGYSFYYEFNYSVTPKDGTEVTSILVNGDDWSIGDDAKTKASQVMSGEFNTPFTTSEPADALYSYFNNYDNEPAPDVYLMVVWTDAAGNYYYKEYPLQSELQKYADKMKEDIGGSADELPTPEGKQWSFNWTALTGGEDCLAVLDFGVTLDGQCIVAYDPAIMGAPEGTPYQIYNMVAYSFEPTDETSGKLIITAVDHFGDEISQEFEYSDLTDHSCYFAFDETSFIGQDADALLAEVEIDMSGGIMQ